MSPIATLSAPKFSRLSDWVGLWSIEESAAQKLLSLCHSKDLFAHVASAERGQVTTGYATAKVGKENIAIIMLTGVMMKSVPSMVDGTSTVEARRSIRKAVADPEINGILLAIDSPGGAVSGNSDLVADIKAASKVKPVFAQIEDLGASAAYEAACAAEKIFANQPEAEVGSIGTLMAVYDQSKQAEAEGIQALVFKTGPLKGAGVPGSVVTPEQQDYFQGRVESAQQTFDAIVQKGRNLTDKQLEKAKTGGVFSAKDAIGMKLIDGIQSLDQTLSQLASEARRRERSSTRSNSVNETIQSDVVDPKAIAEATTKAMREAAAAEAKRVAAINKECAGHPDIIAEAIEQGWSVEKAENAALKASLANKVKNIPGSIIKGSEPRMPDGVKLEQALEAGIQMSLGRRTVEKDYSPNILEAAHSNYRRLGLQQLLILGASQNGYQASPGERINTGNIRDILGHAFPTAGSRQSASSSISMSGILGAVANKEIVGGYEEMDNTWREIAEIKTVNNFQLYTTYRMLDDMEYEELGPDGKIKHGTAGQESYTRQAKLYAKMFKLTYQDIINDDLSAFDSLRKRVGNGSSKKLNKVFWTAFMSNLATTFTSTRTNYISGSTTNLGTDGVGLGLGVKAFRKMTSPAGSAPGSADGGKHINADTQNPVGGNPGGRPEILLVSPELEGNAEVLYRNQNLGSVKNSDANIYQNKYRPVVAWQLSDSSYSGYSSTMWFLLNSPSYLATMAVSFLDGNQTPVVEQADADFDELGVQFRGYHSYGCDVAEYLAGVMSKGAA